MLFNSLECDHLVGDAAGVFSLFAQWNSFSGNLVFTLSADALEFKTCVSLFLLHLRNYYMLTRQFICQSELDFFVSYLIVLMRNRYIIKFSLVNPGVGQHYTANQFFITCNGRYIWNIPGPCSSVNTRLQNASWIQTSTVTAISRDILARTISLNFAITFVYETNSQSDMLLYCWAFVWLTVNVCYFCAVGLHIHNCFN